MKKELFEKVLSGCKEAVIHLKKESIPKFFYSKDIYYLACNTDCFDMHFKGEDGRGDNYCFFYKNVTSIEVYR